MKLLENLIITPAIYLDGTGREAMVGDTLKLFLDQVNYPDFPEFILGIVQHPITKVQCNEATSYVVEYDEADLTGGATTLYAEHVVDVSAASYQEVYDEALQAEVLARIAGDAALDASKAPKHSPTFTGTVTLPTNTPVTATGSTEPRNLVDRFTDVINVRDFGAVGDGVTDDTVAIQAAIDYVANNTVNSAEKLPTFCRLDLAGGLYAVSQQIVVSGPETYSTQYLQIENGGFKALPAFPAQASIILPTIPLLLLQNRSFAAGLHNVNIICEGRCSGVCVVPSSGSTMHTLLSRVFVTGYRNPLMLTETQHNPLDVPLSGGRESNVYRPYGILIGKTDTTIDNPADFLSSSVMTVEKCRVEQWGSSDPSAAFWDNYTGIGIWLRVADARLRGNSVGRSRKSIVIDGWQNEVMQNHPTLGGSGTGLYEVGSGLEESRTIAIEVHWGGNRIIGNYIDNGMLALYNTNNIVIGNFFSKNPLATHLNSTGIIFVAGKVDDTIHNSLVIGDNQCMSTLDRLLSYQETAPYNFLYKISSGSVSEISDVFGGQKSFVSISNRKAPIKVTADGSLCMIEYEVNDETVRVHAGAVTDRWRVLLDDTACFTVGATTVQGDQYQKLQGFVSDVIQTNDAATISTADTYSLKSVNSGDPINFTLSKSAKVGTTVKFINRSSGATTLTPQTGALLNGDVTAKTLTRWLVCTAICYRNPDDLSAEWTLEGTFT